MKNTKATGLFIAWGALTAGLLFALYAPAPCPCKDGDCPCRRTKAPNQHPILKSPKSTANSQQPTVNSQRPTVKTQHPIKNPNLVQLKKPDPLIAPDLVRRWGTKEGVMDVADDQAAAKQVKAQVRGLVQQSQALTHTLSPHVDPEHVRTTQVTVTNHSDTVRTVRLWGGHEDSGVSPPNPDDVEDHDLLAEITVATASVRQPQGVAVNPANGLTYVANQLTNNVTVLDSQGQVVTVIALQADPEAGFTSPVAVAVNRNASSANYGHVYVVGSVSNTVSVIDRSHVVQKVLSVGVRPMAIAYNPVNDRLYVPNLFHNTVSVIDAETETVTATLSAGGDPVGIGVHAGTGDTYVTNSGDHTVTVFDRDDQPVTTLTDVGQRPVTATYHPENEAMYVVAADSDAVYPITTGYTVQPAIPTGRSPYGAAYNPHNRYLYIGNRVDDTFTVLDTDDTVRATIRHGAVNIGFAIDPRESRLWVSDTGGSQVNLIGYQAQSSQVVLNPGYAEDVQEFVHRPAQVQHSRWIFSTDDRFLTLQVRTLSPSGTKETRTISHEQYRSPSNYLNVSEIGELKDSLINGDTRWQYEIGARQTVTVLVHYHRFSLKPLLHPKTSYAP